MINDSSSGLRQPVKGPRAVFNETLINRFMSHVQTAPFKTAIITTEKSWTYQQLYSEVCRWTNLLSCFSGMRVMICLERGPDLLALLLATQCLEITYIPLDPAIPMNRLLAVINDSQAYSIVYDSKVHPLFQTLPCVLYDVQQASKVITVPTIMPTNATNLSGIAYIIYTSGSTGSPKGVAISRRALNNFLASMSQYFLNNEHDLALAITTVSFDISVLELYLPIWQHKTVLITNQHQHKDPLSLAHILAHYPITCIQTTPTFWHMLVDFDWKSHPNLVGLCGGEVLSSSLAQKLLTKVSALWNMYGPTEATVWCALKQIQPGGAITVGRPIHNLEMRVLDAEGQILPPYEKGELFISGIGLAEGYVNNLELTKTKFLTFEEALCGRLYQVGDLACMTEEGECIILGRTDNQIKLHGYRIELEDIEWQIQSFPGISQSAVKVHHEQIVAYLVVVKNRVVDSQKLMQHLAQYLPEYMIPKQVVYLDQLPKTASGKVDRAALPPPMFMDSALNQACHYELSSLEQSLVAIWSEVLNLNSELEFRFKHNTVSIQANFFELGGHSLSAAKIIHRISLQLGKKTSFKDFYLFPTIKQFAAWLETAPLSDLNIIPSAPVKANQLPLHEYQLLYWLSRLSEPKLRRFNVVERKRVWGDLDKTALDAALNWVLENQSIFSYHINRYYPLQTRCIKPVKHWETMTLFHLSKEQTEIFLAKQCDNLFYKKTWQGQYYWISAQAYWLNHNQVELQIGVSHLISDDQSMAVFFRELSNAYLFFTQKIPLPPRNTFCYSNYILNQQAMMQRYADEDAQFWKNYLADTGLFIFPKAFVMPDNPSLSPIHIPLSSKFVAKLKKICSTHAVGMNDLLSAATSLALLEACNGDYGCIPHRLLISALKSTRTEPCLDDAMGCFLRMDIVKLKLHPGITLLELTKQAQQSAHETAEYQRAATLVKIASLGQLPKSNIQGLGWFVKTTLTLIAKYFPSLSLNASLIDACKTMAITDISQQFFVNINVLHNFLQDQSAESGRGVCGLPNAKIPVYPYPLHVIPYAVDIAFHRNNEDKLPFITIATNLTAEFQTNFAQNLIAVIEQSFSSEKPLKQRQWVKQIERASCT